MVGSLALSVALYVYAKKRVSRVFRITTTLARPPQRVFEFHKEPETFYGVLRFSEISMNKHYKPTVTRRTETTIEYDLEHQVGTKVIRSSPARTHIDEKARVFRESFQVWNTVFEFRWQFDAGDSPTSTNVILHIKLEGPRILVGSFSRVQNDFKDRFRITNEHLSELMP